LQQDRRTAAAPKARKLAESRPFDNWSLLFDVAVHFRRTRRVRAPPSACHWRKIRSRAVAPREGRNWRRPSPEL